MAETSKLLSTEEKFPAPLYTEHVLSHIFSDAQRFFFKHLLQLHYAHCLMLLKQSIISQAEAEAILYALDKLDHSKLLNSHYDGTVEDFFFFIEKEIASLIDEDVAGKLHTARSRNDIDVTLYRMAFRDEVLQLTQSLFSLRQTVIELSRDNVSTIMPLHTHTQPAQPSTLAHYLGGVIDFISRDIDRLKAAFERMNSNPLGACAITTSGFPIDRHYVAEILGFNGIVENSYGAIASIDYITEAVSALAIAATNLGRFTQDLLLWSTQEFSYIRVSDGYVQCSSIMPQKRNPVSLEHVRVLLSKAFSQATGVVMSIHNTPFGDINDVEDDLQPLIFSAFKDAKRGVELLGGVLSKITINREILRQRAQEKFITVTEMADTLVRRERLSFKVAHSIISKIVKQFPTGDATPEQFIEKLVPTFEAVTGRKLTLASGELLEALSPEYFVKIRNIEGGPAPERMREFLQKHSEKALNDQNWIRNELTRIQSVGSNIDKERALLILGQEQVAV